MRIVSEIEFARVDGHSLRLDLHLPDERPLPPPLVIWIHGGAWCSGSKEIDEGTYDTYIAKVVAQGLAVASVEYRLSQQAVYPAQIHDVKGAVRWLRAHADEIGVDGERIGALGESAGGHLSALLGTSGNAPEIEGSIGGNTEYSSAVQAAVAVACHSDLLAGQAQLERRPDRIREIDTPDSFESRLMGFPIQQRPELTRLANPITFVGADCPPFLIIHGDEDTAVPWEQSAMLAAAVRGAGAEAVFLTVNGADHFSPHLRGTATTSAMAAFLAEHLLRAPVSA
ncbi:alpha/beta hydrolase [Frankia sp. AgB32]|uniref:alpha/beta hydrolase n=1 Tax=Frankia sp. AgB32 TaxID=631119 RepID=UPI00200E3815|nr:alpha/beta hydrolase [Frankia sp. AgB32]MCK9897077.1 alpha/beta hydrolase [Frankia sp. AgB32]